MGFCHNCGVRRSPVATECAKCGIQFEDRAQLTPALPEWGSLVLDEPPVKNATDIRQDDGAGTRSEELLDKESDSDQPKTETEIEERPAVHRDVSRNSDQDWPPDYSNYHSGRMLDDVLSYFRSSEAELELDVPTKEQKKPDKKKARDGSCAF